MAVDGRMISSRPCTGLDLLLYPDLKGFRASRIEPVVSDDGHVLLWLLTHDDLDISVKLWLEVCFMTLRSAPSFFYLVR